MVIPIFMVVMSLLLLYLINRWLSIIYILVFNLLDYLHTYDNFDSFRVVFDVMVFDLHGIGSKMNILLSILTDYIHGN